MRNGKIELKMPKEFVDELDQFVRTSDLSYGSRNEFVREAIRVHFRNMKD